MSLDLFLTLLVLGGVGGVAAGLLGVGGGVLLFPLLFYVPPLLGLEPLNVKTVAALVISQVFFASIIGGIAHWRKRRIHRQLTLIASAVAIIGSFLGGVASKWVSEWFLLLLFGGVTLLATSMMFLPIRLESQDNIPLEEVKVPLIPLGILSGCKGTVVGFLGAGNFLFVPLMIYFLKVPTRIAIGSNLAIAVLTTFSGFLGKLITGQVPFLMTLPVLIGAGIGALGGEWWHGLISPRALRYIYAAVIGMISLRVWITLLT